MSCGSDPAAQRHIAGRQVHSFTCRPPPKGAAANCGVYIGVSYNEYIGLAAAAQGVSTYTATGGSLSVAAGEATACRCWRVLSWYSRWLLQRFGASHTWRRLSIQYAHYALISSSSSDMP
jgi:hypothetical protein